MAATNYEQLKQDYLGTDTSTGLADQLYKNYLTSGQDATAQAYALKRKQQQDAERDFYNQLYDTNATVLDTIRRNNAAAIASGASKGAQAANELSTILQGQQASVDAATQLAQSNYDLASEEANAYIEAEQAARQQADTTAGALAGNLAVAAQADAAIESSKAQANATIEAANINATIQKEITEKELTYNLDKLTEAVAIYNDPEADDTKRMLAAYTIQSLTQMSPFEFNKEYKEMAGIEDAEAAEQNKTSINSTDYVSQSDAGGTNLMKGLSGRMTGYQFGEQNKSYYFYITPLASGSVSVNDLHISQEQKDNLSEKPNGYLMWIDNRLYALDKKKNTNGAIIFRRVTSGNALYTKAIKEKGKTVPILKQ